MYIRPPVQVNRHTSTSPSYIIIVYRKSEKIYVSIRKRYDGRWATAEQAGCAVGREMECTKSKALLLFTELTFKREIVHRNICNKILCRSERIKRNIFIYIYIYKKKPSTTGPVAAHGQTHYLLATTAARRVRSRFHENTISVRAPAIIFIPRAYSRTRVTERTTTNAVKDDMR